MPTRLLPASIPLLLVAACATAPLPDTWPTGRPTIAVYVARGVQLYACRAADGAPPAWVFVAPEATLYDGAGNVVGRHGAGPSWLATDGSRVVGTVRDRMDAPRAGAIPWLQLDAEASGGGVFAAVTAIQRVNTVGGVAPDGSCAVGTAVRVPYGADYRFLGAG